MGALLQEGAALLYRMELEWAADERKIVTGKYERRGGEVVRKQKKDLPECGARCKSDGHPCRTKVVLGRTRCRVHGGASTGPKTDAGCEAIAASNRRRAEARRQQIGSRMGSR